MAAAQAQVRAAELDLGRTRISAPVAGTVDKVLYRLGERPPPGTTIAVLLDSTPEMLEADADQLAAVRAGLEQKIQIVLLGAAQMAEVEVDLRTFDTRVIDFTAVQEIGTVLNETLATGQVAGGVVQGIGWALNEEYIYDEQGHLLNSSLLDYRMPTSLDLPMIETIIVEVPNPAHPYGVRGVGETGIVPPIATAPM